MSTNGHNGFEKDLDDAKAEAEAISLRTQGLTYREIAERMGCDTSTAWRRCQRALQAAPVEAATEHRSLELLRLEALHAAFWPKALEGSIQAAKLILATMERRAKLLGLDRPTEITLEHFSSADIDAEVERLSRLLSN